MAFPSKEEIDEAIASLGEGGRRFKAKDIRRVLRIDTSDRDASVRVHNRLQALLKSGAAQTHGRNKRNRPYSLTEAGIGSYPSQRVNPAAANDLDERLRRIESMVVDIHTALFSGDVD